MASSPITSWQIEGTKVETVTDFIFLGSKITADGDCSHEIRRHLLPGRKAMTNLDSILKSRDITLSTKFPLVKAMVFPAVVYRCLQAKSRSVIAFLPKSKCLLISWLQSPSAVILEPKKRKSLSSQFQRRAMLKNVQTTRLLCSLPMLVRLCSKSFKLGFSST